VLDRLARRLLRTSRVDVWRGWYRRYDENPFAVDPESISRERFLALAAGTRRNDAFVATLGERFGKLPDAEFVDELALATQVVPKDEELDWSHGFLLYAALTGYLERVDSDRPVTIFETGTARGFSAVCMAKALRDAGGSGKILTADMLHAERPCFGTASRTQMARRRASSSSTGGRTSSRTMSCSYAPTSPSSSSNSG